MQGERFRQQLLKIKHRYLLIFCTIAILCFYQSAAAQSGRRPKPTSIPTVTPQQTTKPVADEPTKPKANQPPVIIQSLIVTGEMQNDSRYIRENYFDSALKRFLAQVENQRLDLKVVKGNRMDFKKAQEKAEKETDNYVLWMNIVMQKNCHPDIIISYLEYAILKPGTGKNLATGRIDLEAIDKVKKITHGIPSVLQPTADTQMQDVAKTIIARMIKEDWVVN